MDREVGGVRRKGSKEGQRWRIRLPEGQAGNTAGNRKLNGDWGRSAGGLQPVTSPGPALQQLSAGRVCCWYQGGGTRKSAVRQIRESGKGLIPENLCHQSVWWRKSGIRVCHQKGAVQKKKGLVELKIGGR